MHGIRQADNVAIFFWARECMNIHQLGQRLLGNADASNEIAMTTMTCHWGKSGQDLNLNFCAYRSDLYIWCVEEPSAAATAKKRKG